MSKHSLTHLSDGTLLRDLTVLVARDRVNTAELLAHLAEVDARRLYLPAGYPSMHAYCEQELRLSEDTANKRIRVARKAREIPALFAAIADGRLNLSGVILLASQLTPNNADELIKAAEGKSKVEIEELMATRQPRSEEFPIAEALPAAPSQRSIERVEEPIVSVVRKQPAPGPVGTKRSRVEPIAQQRYVLRACLGQETLDKLHRAQALLSHKIPSGDLPAVLDRVLELAIQQLEKKKFGAASKHRPLKTSSSNPRHIPARIKHAVWQRDGGQCTLVSESGHRCMERKLLEFDHAVPVAHGGDATLANLRLRCRAHNVYAAEKAFGAEFMRRKLEDARDKAAEETRKADAREKANEVIPWLRALRVPPDVARCAAERCASIPDAPIEDRVRLALSYLGSRIASPRMPATGLRAT
jgi:5-methylcytosine-specific restriction endonuclease McrA